MKLNMPEKLQQEFNDFIENKIPNVKFLKPDGKPRKEWKIFYGKTWDTARSAALNAAQSTAEGAAKHAALVAAEDAAWDAALYSEFIVVSDLEFKDKEKHQKHVEARWEVWRKGYGLLCDVDGVLYVYAGRPKMKA